MAPFIAFAAFIFRPIDLMRAGLWIARIGAIISPILLVMDLGRPCSFSTCCAFSNRSPMSMGAWILSLFGACAVPAWLVH